MYEVEVSNARRVDAEDEWWNWFVSTFDEEKLATHHAEGTVWKSDGGDQDLAKSIAASVAVLMLNHAATAEIRKKRAEANAEKQRAEDQRRQEIMRAGEIIAALPPQVEE